MVKSTDLLIHIFGYRQCSDCKIYRSIKTDPLKFIDGYLTRKGVSILIS